jgi:hypothetical protein
VVAFWLLDFLGIEIQSMRRAEAHEFWSSRAGEFLVVAEYVAKRVAAYSWPSDFELRSQYRDLMLHWGKLCTRKDVQEHVLVQPQHEQAQTCRPPQKRLTAARRQASLQLTTGEEEHGSPIVGFWPPKACNSSNSLQASQQQAIGSGREVTEFKWEAWWQFVHTGCLPNGVVVNCVPQNCAAAWAVFHFSGMFGTSEAFAESIGGILKRFSKSLSTARCVESNILRSAGLTGFGGGGEDGFLELCWADFLGAGKSFLSITGIRRNDGSILSWGRALRR